MARVAVAANAAIQRPLELVIPPNMRCVSETARKVATCRPENPEILILPPDRVEGEADLLEGNRFGALVGLPRGGSMGVRSALCVHRMDGNGVFRAVSGVQPLGRVLGASREGLPTNPVGSLRVSPLGRYTPPEHASTRQHISVVRHPASRGGGAVLLLQLPLVAECVRAVRGRGASGSGRAGGASP